jgi:hypothetical protein
MRAQRIGSSTVPGLYGYILVQSSIKRLLFRVPSILSLRCAFARRDYLLGFLPFPDTITSLPIICEASTASLARTTAFSTVRSLLQHDLRVYFIPQPSLGLSLVQGLVHFVQPSTFIRSVPPLPFSIRTLTCKQAATYEHLDSDVLLHTRALPFGSVISLSNRRLPSSSFLLLQVHPTPAKTVTCSRTLMTFPPSRFHLLRGEGFCGTDARLQRISDDGLGCFRCRSFRPARAFRTFLTYLSKSHGTLRPTALTLRSLALASTRRAPKDTPIVRQLRRASTRAIRHRVPGTLTNLRPSIRRHPTGESPESPEPASIKSRGTIHLHNPGRPSRLSRLPGRGVRTVLSHKGPLDSEESRDPQRQRASTIRTAERFRPRRIFSAPR